MIQEEAYKHLLGPENCFLTGPAGSGKSYLINKLMEELEGDPGTIALTATTGIAARNIGGQTLHSYLGVGLGRKRDEHGKLQDFELFWNKCMFSPYFNKTGISQCQCLIIDEISMMMGWFLQDVNLILKRVKQTNQPFGGIKVILTGDFLQLPPVTNASIYDWAFKSKAWKNGNIHILNLEKSYRQTDEYWIQCLNDLRVAKISPKTEELLATRAVYAFPEEFQGTILMTHNQQVRNYNADKLRELPGQSKIFTAICNGKSYKIEAMLASMTTPRDLEIKVGAKVLATINDREGAYYNGSLGEVVSWTPEYVAVQFEDNPDTVEVRRFTFSDEHRNLKGNKPEVTIRQFPLKLAWSITIHAAQGMSLSKVYVNAEHVFTAHQLYVALSRCRTLEGLSIYGFDKRKCYVDYDARNFYENLAKESNEAIIPV